MKLYALSDLHLGHKANREALLTLQPRPDDWVAVVGDVGESLDDLRFAWDTLCSRFAKVLWAPGNHELWTLTSRTSPLRGVAKYDALVALCREYGVHTPEDPWLPWPADPSLLLAPLLLLYDYSFGPDGMSRTEALAWAREHRLRCRDEDLLHTEPYPDIQSWCHARCDAAEARLEQLEPGQRVVLINHFPLRGELVRLHRIPRFRIWCGTTRTEDWHRRYPVHSVISGHLHLRCTDWIDGVRFEEVSLGNPRHYASELGAEGYLREILPGPPTPPGGQGGPLWHL